jgi:ATP/maltotriose-dependent transcriptional regulator MalT
VGKPAGEPASGAPAGLADAKPASLQRSEYLLARAEQEMESEMDITLHGEFNALRAQVAINDGDPEEAERLAMVALDELPLANFYSRIVATSVHGELHCKAS